jgi:Glycosyl hydrolases family 15
LAGAAGDGLRAGLCGVAGSRSGRLDRPSAERPLRGHPPLPARHDGARDDLHHGRGILRITDALTFGALGTLPWAELAGIVDVDEGEVPVAWEVRPGHCLSAGKSPWAHVSQETPMLLVGDYRLAVVCDGLGEPAIKSNGVTGRAVLTAGEPAMLAVIGTETEPVHVPSADEIRARVERTIKTWRHWAGLITYHGRWGDLVLRSALMLKALTLKVTGAIAAAATTSLPEQPGGQRNFDYRYAWIRDSSFALDAMSRLGLSEELHAGVCWLLDAVSHEAPALRVFYALSGEPVSSEMTEVDNVPGYRGSLPVNVGNGAAGQTQLRAYGHLLDAVGHYCAHGGILSSVSAGDARRHRRSCVRHLAITRCRVVGAGLPGAVHKLKARLLGGAGPRGAPLRRRSDHQPPRSAVAR